jgi:hypothetical protein
MTTSSEANFDSEDDCILTVFLTASCLEVDIVGKFNLHYF